MAKGGKRAYSDNTIKEFKFRVGLIEKNVDKYFQTFEERNENLQKMNRKDTSSFGVTKESMNLFLEINKKRLSLLERGKIDRKEAREIKFFIEKYKFASYTNYKYAERRYVLNLRDEYISRFESLGVDKDILETLRKSRLWNNNEFWQSYFNNREIFVPLTNQYGENKTSTEGVDDWNAQSQEKGYKTSHSIWGDAIYSYAKYFMEHKKDKFSKKERDKFKDAFDFNYMKENK